jgi:hypothetical protein
MIQVYTFPILLEQDQPRLVTALRNSMVLYLRRPGFSLALLATLLALALISTLFVVPWALITASLSAYLANRGALYLIRDLSGEPQEKWMI